MLHYFVYILLCENDSYYTGYTPDLLKRYEQHVKGTGGCKYTRSFKPLSIVQCWKITGPKALAMQIERYIKKLPRSEKEKMIIKPAMLIADLRGWLTKKESIEAYEFLKIKCFTRI